MTIAVAWERRLPTYSELIVCSDSRLTGGGHIDVCQKIFPTPREDMAIAFCGSTLIAYPLINQLISYVRNYKKSVDRALDSAEVPRRFCELINQFLQSYTDPAELEKELYSTNFLLCHYSWKARRPMISRITYEKSTQRYVPIRGRVPKSISKTLHKEGGAFSIIGDYRHKFFDGLMAIMNERKIKKFDLEPLEVMCTMLQDPELTDRSKILRGAIGGAPQMVKIYPFLKTIEFAVRWGEDRRIYLNGREIFEYEKIFAPILNSGDMTFEYPLEAVELESGFETLKL